MLLCGAEDAPVQIPSSEVIAPGRRPSSGHRPPPTDEKSETPKGSVRSRGPRPHRPRGPHAAAPLPWAACLRGGGVLALATDTLSY